MDLFGRIDDWQDIDDSNASDELQRYSLEAEYHLEDFHWPANVRTGQEVLLRRVHTLLYRLGFTDFAYRMLLPVSARPWLGTLPKSCQTAYREDKLARHDLVALHALRSDSPVFQSQVDGWIERSPLTVEALQCYRKVGRWW